MPMIKRSNHLFHDPIQFMKIDDHAKLVEDIRLNMNPHPPIVTMEPLTSALVSPKLMGCGKNPFSRNLKHGVSPFRWLQ
jgi:hypothetical protein